jgi:hypothetical protein
MSNIEPEVKGFLKRILLSLSMGLGWLMVNMTLGIYFGLLFPAGRLRIGNGLFYLFFAGSLFFVSRFLLRTWKRKFPHG